MLKIISATVVLFLIAIATLGVLYPEDGRIEGVYLLPLIIIMGSFVFTIPSLLVLLSVFISSLVGIFKNINWRWNIAYFMIGISVIALYIVLEMPNFSQYNFTFDTGIEMGIKGIPKSTLFSQYLFLSSKVLVPFWLALNFWVDIRKWSKKHNKETQKLTR